MNTPNTIKKAGKAKVKNDPFADVQTQPIIQPTQTPIVTGMEITAPIVPLTPTKVIVEEKPIQNVTIPSLTNGTMTANLLRKKLAPSNKGRKAGTIGKTAEIFKVLKEIENTPALQTYEDEDEWLRVAEWNNKVGASAMKAMLTKKHKEKVAKFELKATTEGCEGGSELYVRYIQPQQ